MEQTELCPCCGRHCELKNPHCERGREYLRTGIVPERHHREDRTDIEDRQQHNQTIGIQDKLIFNLRDLSHIMRALYEGKGSQKNILIILNEVGDITQRELTERLGIQPGSVSEVIAKLENARDIMRTPSEKDRRTMDITLTPRGKVSALEAAEQRNRRHVEMFSCLSNDEKEILLSLLEKVNVDWKDRYQEVEEIHRRCGQRHGSHMHHGKGHR